MQRSGSRVLKIISYNDALAIFSKIFRDKVPEYEIIPVNEALGRIIAEDIFADVNVPENNISLMDGFAVKYEDTLKASPERPVKLNVVGRLYPWSRPDSINISSGQACYVACGAPVPIGANAVIRIENVILLGEKIEIKHSVKNLENVCLAGEDIKAGSLISRKDTILRPQDVGVLAGLGVKRVKVYRRPRVAIISTGDELIERSKKDPEVIVNNYALILSGLIAKIGGEPMLCGIAPDNLTEIRRKISEALNKADIVVTIGGCSFGEKDFVPEAVDSLGEPGVVFHGVMIKPGKVSGFGLVRDKPIVMLPGLFASTVAGFYLIFVPVMCLYMGLGINSILPKISAVISQDVLGEKKPYHVFLPLSIKSSNEGLIAEPAMNGPASLSRFMKANGFISLPPGRALRKGERVSITLFSCDELFKIMS